MKVQTTFARVALCAAVLSLAACDDDAMTEGDSGVLVDAGSPGDGDVGDGDVVVVARA